jgi:hypothetical protein
MRRILLALALLLAASAAHAQLNVGIEVKKRTYVRHEPLLVTVTLENLTGRDLMLSDGEAPWFSFVVMHGEEKTILPPRNPDYKLEPYELRIGETVKRTVNLVDLYPITEYGIHRIRATIYVKSLNQFFSSKTANIDISEGRTVWKQVVGVPETMKNAGDMHEFTLLAAQGSQHQYLYCRVTDPGTGKVFGMYKIGHMIDGSQFDAKFDATNTLHVLHLIGPKTYSLTQIGPNGEVHGQWTYDAPKFKPSLRRDPTGNLDIIGATRRVEAAKNLPPPPKASDRPPGLPPVR